VPAGWGVFILRIESRSNESLATTRSDPKQSNRTGPSSREKEARGQCDKASKNHALFQADAREDLIYKSQLPTSDAGGNNRDETDIISEGSCLRVRRQGEMPRAWTANAVS